jgi:hypothetical protein
MNFERNFPVAGPAYMAKSKVLQKQKDKVYNYRRELVEVDRLYVKSFLDYRNMKQMLQKRKTERIGISEQDDEKFMKLRMERNARRMAVDDMKKKLQDKREKLQEMIAIFNADPVVVAYHAEIKNEYDEYAARVLKRELDARNLDYKCL